MGKEGGDVLMRICNDKGPIPAECQTEVDSDDDDFVSDYVNGQFFEIDKFSFGVKIDDGDAAMTRHAESPPKPKQPGKDKSDGDRSDGDRPAASQSGAFARWKSASKTELANLKPYPVRIDPIDVSRLYDKASPLLFQYCCDSLSFKSASIVKRKDIGDGMLRGFLRLEFDDVLITHVGWDNDDPPKEKFKFVFRKLKVRYRTVGFETGQQTAVMHEIPPVWISYDAKLVGWNSNKTGG